MISALLLASATATTPAMTDDLAAFCDDLTTRVAVILLPIVERTKISPEMIDSLTERQAFLYFIRNGSDLEAEMLLMLADASASAGCQF